MASNLELPIRRFAADIVAAVKSNDCVVVIGETGSGKTTQLSQVQRESAHSSRRHRAAVEPHWPHTDAARPSSLHRSCWRPSSQRTDRSLSPSLAEWCVTAAAARGGGNNGMAFRHGGPDGGHAGRHGSMACRHGGTDGGRGGMAAASLYCSWGATSSRRHLSSRCDRGL